MEVLWATITVAVGIFMVWAWTVVRWVWLTPVKLERRLRLQGLQGTPYTLLFGDSNEMLRMRKEATSKPMNLSHDIAPRTESFIHQIVNKYGTVLVLSHLVLPPPLLFQVFTTGQILASYCVMLLSSLLSKLVN